MTVNAFATVVRTAGEGGFEPPSPEEFYFPLFSVGGFVVTRPMVLMTVATALILLAIFTMVRRPQIVPSKGQWLFEQVYDFVRNGVARDMIGHEFLRFVPVLFALFTFILVNNLFGSTPFANFPTMSRIGGPMALVLIVYVLYHVAGVQKHGLVGYFKTMIPPQLPILLVPLIFVLELMNFFITRPLTLTLRLFGNMFAGHMLMGVFILGGTYLLSTGSLGLMAAGVGAYGMGALMQALELLIEALQAYVFVMLSASYFGAAVADEH